MSQPQGAGGRGNGVNVNRQACSTYAGQTSLPRLPIPTLEETLERFPAVVCALFSSSQDSDGEMEKCLEEIRYFLNNDGPILQELLVEYDRRGRDDGNMGSFVEEFWSDAYLAPDSSVVMNLNPFFVLEVSRTVPWLVTRLLFLPFS